MVLFAADLAAADELAPEDTLACMERVSDAPKELHAALYSKCVQLTAAYCHGIGVTRKCYARFQTKFERKNTAQRAGLLYKIELAEAVGDGEALEEMQGLLDLFLTPFDCPAGLEQRVGACEFVEQMVTMLLFCQRKSLSEIPHPPPSDESRTELKRQPNIVQCLSAFDPLVKFLRESMQEICFLTAEYSCRKLNDSEACFARYEMAMAEEVHEILKLLLDEIEANILGRFSYRRGMAKLQAGKREKPCKGSLAEKPKRCDFSNQFITTQNALWLARLAGVRGHLE